MEEFVYFFEAVGAGGLVKIGFTENPGRRFQQIKTACPHKLVALCIVPANKGLESVLHTVLKGCRKHGEWFQLSDDARNIVMVFGLSNSGSKEENFQGIEWAEDFADFTDGMLNDFSQVFGRLFLNNMEDQANAN